MPNTRNASIANRGGAAALSAALTFVILPTAGALANGYERGYVVAESRYGKGVVRGAVRYGHRGGLEVQLPRGTWVHCERSCSETLRRQTVDFWESNGPQAKDTGPGYFSWSFRY